jgi:hypothetical protein
VKPCLKKRAVAFDVTELARLPAVFFFIERRVENEAVGVQMRVGDSIHWPCRGMDIFAPDHVARDAVNILPALAYAGFHFRFDLTHRLVH